MILQEKLFLNEKFGNMPNWLKSNLKYKAAAHKSPYAHRNSRRNLKSYNIGRDVQYDYSSDDLVKKPDPRKGMQVDDKDRFDNSASDLPLYNSVTSYADRYQKNEVGWNEQSEKWGLFNNLLQYGLDPSNLEVIEEPLPTSVRDKHLKDPYIPVFLLSSLTNKNSRIIQQVYIKGVNDEEISEVIDRFDYKQLKRLPMKDLINPDYCKKFAYIDTTNKDNWLDQDKLNERNKYFNSIGFFNYYQNADELPRDNTGKLKDSQLPNHNENRYDLYKLKYDKGTNLLSKVEDEYKDVVSSLKDLVKYISWTDTEMDLEQLEDINDIKRGLERIKNSELNDVDPDNYTMDGEGRNGKKMVGDYYGNRKQKLNDLLASLKSYSKSIDNIKNDISKEDEIAELDWE